MIYILGHSHAIKPLHALSADGMVLNHDNWDDSPREIAFQELRCKEALGIMQPVKYFLISGKQNMYATTHEVQGERKITVTTNFDKLIRSIEDSPQTKLCGFINGNEHSSLSLVEHEVPYDFVRPGDNAQAASPPLPIVPLPIVRTRVFMESHLTLGTMEALRNMLPQSRIYVFLPPPPLPSNKQIMDFPETFIFKTHNVAPPILRLKYYQEYIRAVQFVANATGIACVPSPEGATTPEGFLAEPYWGTATHANMEYAKRAAEQIREVTQ